MSTLKANTVETSSGGAVTLTNQNAAKAYAYVLYTNGTPSSAGEGSLNIASYTDNGTGDYNANYTNNMSSDNYSRAGMGVWNIRCLTFYNATTTYFRGNNYNIVSNTHSDNVNGFSIHGELA